MKQITLILIILGFGCNQREVTHNKSNSFSQTNSCVLNISIDSAEAMILNSAKLFNRTYSQNDSCYLIFIDNLLGGSCGNKSQKKLLLLDSLFRISDGYVGEYFADTVGITLFENCFDSVLEYISKNKQTSLFQLLTNSLLYNIEIAKTFAKQKVIDKLDYYLEKEISFEYREIITSIKKVILDS